SLVSEWGSNGRAGRRTNLSGAAARSYQVTPAGPSHPATAIRMQASPRASGTQDKSQSPDGKDPTTATSAAPASLTLTTTIRLTVCSDFRRSIGGVPQLPDTP